LKGGEAQQAENLDYGSFTESFDFCKVSGNTNVIVTDKDSQITHEDHTGFSKGESKWEKFLKINSCDDICKFSSQIS